jgi:hypothetical protein
MLILIEEKAGVSHIIDGHREDVIVFNEIDANSKFLELQKEKTPNFR